MAEKKDRSISRFKGGVFQDITNRIKLILRLMGDARVNPLLKLIPIGSLIYLIFPDIAPGPIDDAAVIWLGAYLFVELCPPDVVQEHMAAIASTIPGSWRDPQEEVIEGEFRDE
jgi:hypothetical protein